jgi:hypothetical protein
MADRLRRLLVVAAPLLDRAGRDLGTMSTRGGA